MKLRGLILSVLFAAVVVYFIFFAKVVGDKGGLEVMTDKYAESKVNLTGTDLESLAKVILSFAAEGEGLPEALEALRRYNPVASARTDIWGHRIRYEKLSDDSFRLTSAGPDGVFDTADDIVRVF
jgi:hypothetical protein